MSVDISQALEPGDIEEIQRLFTEYAESLGFHEIAPYYTNPIPNVRYYELDLTAGL